MEDMIMMPREFTAGDSLDVTNDLPSYPAPEWVLRITMHNATSAITLVSEPESASHRIVEAPEVSAQWAAGRYDWTAYVTGPDSARVTLDTGAIIIHPDPQSADPADRRTHARKMLDALEAALEHRATRKQIDLIRVASHGQKDVQRDVAKLMELRDRYRREVSDEERAEALRRGEHIPHDLKVRFL
jgi:hypothetical protein